MAWNKPSTENQQSIKKNAAKAPSVKRGIIAGAVVAVALGALCLYLFSNGEVTSSSLQKEERGRIKEVVSSKPQTTAEAEDEASKIKRVRAELNDQVKEFVRKSPTNRIDWAFRPLDPDDPNNIFRTAIAKDISTLLAIEPGEDVPRILPFSFMFEDDEIEASAANGAKVLTVDGGNKQFLADLKKWKVAIKEKDGDERVAFKSAFLNAQVELLNGIEDGMSVNDSIRAAYQFRVRAAEMRNDMIRTLRELHTEDPDVSATRALIEKANEQLKGEGIKTIPEDEIIPESEGESET